jgi:hypothetical protein
MKRVLVAVVAVAFVVGCGKSETAPAAGEKAAVAAGGKAAAPAGGALKADLDKLKASIEAAKTGDDFLKVISECGGLEIKGAMTGKKVAEDPDYKAVCKVQVAHTRAKLAIKESTKDKMSTHCLAASMNLDDLVSANLEKAASEKLQADLKKACGM